MVITVVITLVVLAVLAAVGFIMANRAETKADQAVQTFPTNEDIVTYLAAEVPAILHDVLESVPLATVEEAMTGCYGTMGPGGRAQTIRPYQTSSLDELLTRTMEAVTGMENEQPISKFTISTQTKSKTNPHVDLLAHSSTEPKRTRMIRFWRTQDGFVANLSD